MVPSTSDYYWHQHYENQWPSLRNTNGECQAENPDLPDSQTDKICRVQRILQQIDPRDLPIGIYYMPMDLPNCCNFPLFFFEQ